MLNNFLLKKKEKEYLFFGKIILVIFLLCALFLVRKNGN